MNPSDENQSKNKINRIVDGLKKLLEKEDFTESGGLFLFETTAGIFAVGREFKALTTRELANYISISLHQLYGEEFTHALLQEVSNLIENLGKLSGDGVIH